MLNSQVTQPLAYFFTYFVHQQTVPVLLLNTRQSPFEGNQIIFYFYVLISSPVSICLGWLLSQRGDKPNKYGNMIPSGELNEPSMLQDE